MDRVAKSTLNKPRPPLFRELPARNDLEQYFGIVKRNDTIYYVAVQDEETKGTLFVGADYTMRFFLTATVADQYREFCQMSAPSYKFFIVRFEAIDGIARGISDVKTSAKPSSLKVSTYKNGLLVDIDLVYSTKQLLN